MVKSESHIPKLRFKGFSGEWSNEKLGKVTNYMKGFAFSANLYQSKGIQVIRVSDLGINSIVEKGAQVFIDRSLIDTYKNYIINKNDILITTVGSKSELQDSAVGRAIFIKNDTDGLLNQNLVKITGNGVSSSFLYCLFLQKKYRDHIAMIERGNANQANITIADLWEYKFQKPEYKEQTQIGNFFQKIDQVIELQQKALDTARDYKKSMLQKMFPQKGEKVPQIRFDGFSGDWEETLLGKIAKISSGVTGDIALNEGNFLITRIETISEGVINLDKVGYINEKPDDRFLLQKGDLLYSNINSLKHIGKTAFYNDDVEIYHGINLLRIIPNDICALFLFITLRTEDKLNWARSHANQAVNQASINQTTLGKLTLLTPKIGEQQKIGEFFQKLDQRIEQHEKKLESYQNLKKAMLQRLFV